jgi:hypothetical protein
VKQLSLTIIVTLCLFLTGCLGGETSVEIKNSDYQIKSPDNNWTLLKTKSLKADHAFQNLDTGSSFYLRSSCNIYKDASLKQLTFGLVRLFENPNILTSKKGKLAKRDTQMTTLTGKMDGVTVKAKLTLLKKNSCNFDFVFISLPKFFQKDLAAYEKFLHSFNL